MAYATHWIRGCAGLSELRKVGVGRHEAGHDDGTWTSSLLVMAGLGPAIHVLFISNAYDVRMGGWVYIMTNRRNGTLYIGVTNDLLRRVWEHREGVGSSFVRKYGLTRLVYCERHEDIQLYSAKPA